MNKQKSRCGHYPKGCRQMNLHSSVLFGGMLLEPVECGITRERELGLELVLGAMGRQFKLVYSIPVELGKELSRHQEIR